VELKTKTKPLTIFIPGPFGLRKKLRAAYNQNFKFVKN
jgi:23S rRNA pseudoU1915 N3-methylase RlmH